MGKQLFRYKQTCGRDLGASGVNLCLNIPIWEPEGRYLENTRHCISQTQGAWGTGCTKLDVIATQEGRLPEDEGSHQPGWEILLPGGSMNRDRSAILTPRTLIIPTLLRPPRIGKPTYQAVPEWGRKAGDQMREHGWAHHSTRLKSKSVQKVEAHPGTGQLETAAF